MRIIYLNIRLIAILFVLVVSSCNKEKEALLPFSLLSKNARLTAHVWEFEKFLVNGVEDTSVTNIFDIYTLEFTKEGEVILNISYQGTNIVFKGIWKFNDDKSQIGVKWEGDIEFDYARIVKLTGRQFWIEDTDENTGDKYESHFVRV
ncbi:MAG: hypothetical protein IIA88_11445 [Bacteroidetes bacterium]|nr:hypothetical protein [Bacteroidota bacterium]